MILKRFEITHNKIIHFFQNGIKLTDPKFYANITKEKLSEILKSDSNYEIPLLEERAQVLQEAGKKLVEV